MMSRDGDSPIISRELNAVQQWLDSDRDFHVMRDHYHHGGFKILGGTFLRRPITFGPTISFLSARHVGCKVVPKSDRFRTGGPKFVFHPSLHETRLRSKIARETSLAGGSVQSREYQDRTHRRVDFKNVSVVMQMAHVSYSCNLFEPSVPFPTQRDGRQTFVGMIGDVKENSELLPECPKSCRPPDHPDWIYC